MKTAVIYQSKYGTTKQYAEWIAAELDADLFERKEVKDDMLASYDIVVYGGGLYAGGIAGVDLVTKNHCKNLIVFTVGLADPAHTDYSDILNKNFTPELKNATKVFHLRGGIDYKKLGFTHKSMMAMLKKLVDKKAENERTSEEKAILETYGTQVDFTNQETIAPIIEYVRMIF